MSNGDFNILDSGSFDIFDFADTSDVGDGLWTGISADDFDGDTLGDTVGVAGSLVNLLKTGLSTGADILGGSDAKGGAGFVPQKNPALETAIGTQIAAIRQAAGRQEDSVPGPQWQNRNTHSNAIMRSFNEDALTAFTRILTAARSGESASRIFAKARAT